MLHIIPHINIHSKEKENILCACKTPFKKYNILESAMSSV